MIQKKRRYEKPALHKEQFTIGDILTACTVPTNATMDQCGYLFDPRFSKDPAFLAGVGACKMQVGENTWGVCYYQAANNLFGS